MWENGSETNVVSSCERIPFGLPERAANTARKPTRRGRGCLSEARKQERAVPHVGVLELFACEELVGCHALLLVSRLDGLGEGRVHEEEPEVIGARLGEPAGPPELFEGARSDAANDVASIEVHGREVGALDARDLDEDASRG